MTEIPTKRCNTCHKYLSLASFQKLTSAKDGLNPKCRACKQLARSTPQCKATANKRQNERYATEPEFRQQKIDNAKTQQNKKPDHGIGRFQAYIATKSPEWEADVKRQWAKDHPVEWSAKSQRYAARKRGAEIVEDIDLLTLAERDNWICHICHKKVSRTTWSMDHLIPLSKGGNHTWDNVSLAHRRCNSKRGAGRLPAQLLLAPFANPTL